MVVTQARDDDSGANARLTYTLNPGLATSTKFAISSLTGGISTIDTFDFDVDDTQFLLTVRATDQGDIPRFRDVVVTISA